MQPLHAVQAVENWQRGVVATTIREFNHRVIFSKLAQLVMLHSDAFIFDAGQQVPFLRKEKRNTEAKFIRTF